MQSRWLTGRPKDRYKRSSLYIELSKGYQDDKGHQTHVNQVGRKGYQCRINTLFAIVLRTILVRNFEAQRPMIKIATAARILRPNVATNS